MEIAHQARRELRTAVMIQAFLGIVLLGLAAGSIQWYFRIAQHSVRVGFEAVGFLSCGAVLDHISMRALKPPFVPIVRLPKPSHFCSSMHMIADRSPPEFMRQLVIALLAMTSLHTLCAHADRVSDLSAGLNSSDVVITENRSAQRSLTKSTILLFEDAAKKHEMQCHYDRHTNEVIKPPYPTLACGPKHISLVVLQPIWDRHYYVFSLTWFEASCKAGKQYTKKQLKAMAESFSDDFRSALATSGQVTQISPGQQKGPGVGTPCPVPDPDIPDVVF